MLASSATISGGPASGVVDLGARTSIAFGQRGWSVLGFLYSDQ